MNAAGTPDYFRAIGLGDLADEDFARIGGRSSIPARRSGRV